MPLEFWAAWLPRVAKMLPTGSDYPRHVQPDEPRAEPPVQLPLWADEPPEEAAPLLDAIERLREPVRVFLSSTSQDTSTLSAVRSFLRSQAIVVESSLPDFDYSGPVLLPDFTGDDYRALNATVWALIVTNLRKLAEVEQVVEVASADPESRRLVARISEHLPSRAQVAKMTPWAVLVMVSIAMLKVAPEINPNDIAMLAVILMVVLYLLPPRSGS
jgi:hypothetical protein